MRALGVDLATSRTQSWILSARKQKVNQVAASQKHGSTNLLDSCSGGRYAGRSVRAKAARGSTRSSSSSSSSMEVDLPPTAALEQQDLLGGQLKRRREAEQECRRLEGENLKLRGSLGDLEAMVAVLEEENAQFGAERERLEGENTLEEDLFALFEDLKNSGPRGNNRVKQVSLGNDNIVNLNK